MSPPPPLSTARLRRPCTAGIAPAQPPPAPRRHCAPDFVLGRLATQSRMGGALAASPVLGVVQGPGAAEADRQDATAPQSGWILVSLCARSQRRLRRVVLDAGATKWLQEYVAEASGSPMGCIVPQIGRRPFQPTVAEERSFTAPDCLPVGRNSENSAHPPQQNKRHLSQRMDQESLAQTRHEPTSFGANPESPA